ncbi:ABC transporter substrate-binding protein [Cereibacter changlensis]|uniref:ABC transporter substrate-binding protein n=1 Tax=Cereibacter changlensis TaxID=402884 RepID=A0A4V5NLD7_9RHOB|nr:extracellular solute-binding protein [Cereibacter changlensis]TKA95267.1 ABC transporter substrate-binding protein [Cereibacter changlensis]
MKQNILARLRHAATLILLAATAAPAGAESAHGIAMYGEPALPPDFVALPYANPDAPKGGRIVLGETGGFDSLNPYIVMGRAPVGLGLGSTPLTVETLMARSLDEPFTLYGLLAESVETDAARSFVEFTLREGARFSDGSPVTVEDVIWSFEKLGTEGMPRYRVAWTKIAKSEITGPRSVRFTFNQEDRELPLVLGLRPILKKAQWEGKDFTASTLEPPIGSGPYVVDTFEPGRFISYRRDPDWWGKDLPINRGLHNFDEVRYDYFGDSGVVFEAFKSGALSSYRETNAAKWAVNYAFPAVQSGDVVLAEIPHGRPSGMEGLVFNTRRPMFQDWRVREALIHAFNFELINRTLTGGAQLRISSYFSNSALGFAPGEPAEGAVKALLEPYAGELLPGALEGYALPVSDGSEANRRNMRAAMKLLGDAGWAVENGVLQKDGQPFRFEILLAQGAGEMISVASIYVEALKRLGIEARITAVDAAQLKQRTDAQDFDMMHFIRAMSLSPGAEQTLYWAAAGKDQPGSRNLMGMESPAAEAMIARILSSTEQEDFVAATQALDRVLTTGRYVIPMWYSKVSRLAHRKELKYPAKLPVYGDWPGFQPDVWWFED